MALEFERRAKESEKAFAAFALYLSMGPERSLDAVRQKCGKSARLIQRWSGRWRWPERVAAHAMCTWPLLSARPARLWRVASRRNG